MSNPQDVASRRFAGGLAALLTLAIAVRIVAVLLVASYRLDRVTYEHGEIARNLVEGRGFTVRWLGAEGPTSQQAPVYPALVAIFYWLFGVQSPAALFALEILQAILGGLLPVGVVVLMKELLPDRSLERWAAGVGVALYPTLIYAVTQVQVATLVSLFVVGVLWTATRVVRLGRLCDAGCCGVAAALLVLTDPIMVLVLAVALVVIVRRRAGSSLALACVTLAAFGAVVAPWIVRNYAVHGELVFVKSTFGYAFWQGNHPRSFGTDKIPVPRSSPAAEPKMWGLQELERALWHTRLVDTMYIDDAVLTREQVQELAVLPEPVRSRRLLAEAIATIRVNPNRYVRLSLQRLRFFLLFDETNPKSQVRIYRVAHLALQALALLGLWLSRKDRSRLWPTYLVFVLVTGFHSLTIVSARFHLPLESIEWIWAGFPCAAVVAMVWRMLTSGIFLSSAGRAPAHSAAGAGLLS